MGFFKNPLKAHKKIFDKTKPGSNPLGLGGGGGNRGAGSMVRPTGTPRLRAGGPGGEAPAAPMVGRNSLPVGAAMPMRQNIPTKPMRQLTPMMGGAGSIRTKPMMVSGPGLPPQPPTPQPPPRFAEGGNVKGNKTMTPHKKAPAPRPGVDKGFKGKKPEKGFGKDEKKPFGKK